MTKETREFIQGRLARRRADLRAATGGLREAQALAVRVSPAWTVLDALRHILAWQEVTLRSLDDWLGPRDFMPPTEDEDERNVALLAERAGLGLMETLGRIEASYERFESLLRASDAELAEVGLAPWGERITRLQAISGILWHDGEHLREVIAALRL
ncbi:MAG TPA: DinB family protein [Roseiflexaceae bacterium]|nr:DinB family protein [Roseiflexaceae bacterium]